MLLRYAARDDHNDRPVRCRWPVAVGRWPAPGVRRPVAGGRRPVSGGRWPLASGRCFGGRWQWPVSDVRCPVSGGRCPVAGEQKKSIVNEAGKDFRTADTPHDMNPSIHMVETSILNTACEYCP